MSIGQLTLRGGPKLRTTISYISPSPQAFPQKSTTLIVCLATPTFPMSHTLHKSLQLCERLTPQQRALRIPLLRHSDKLRSNCLPTTRPFSASTQCRASAQGRAIKPSGKKQTAPSMALQMGEQRKQMMRNGMIPDDLGLLPETIIMPRGKNRPSWFGDFKARWRMEKKRWRVRVVEGIR